MWASLTCMSTDRRVALCRSSCISLQLRPLDSIRGTRAPPSASGATQDSSPVVRRLVCASRPPLCSSRRPADALSHKAVRNRTIEVESSNKPLDSSWWSTSATPLENICGSVIAAPPNPTRRSALAHCRTWLHCTSITSVRDCCWEVWTLELEEDSERWEAVWTIRCRCPIYTPTVLGKSARSAYSPARSLLFCVRLVSRTSCTFLLDFQNPTCHFEQMITSNLWHNNIARESPRVNWVLYFRVLCFSANPALINFHYSMNVEHKRYAARP